MEPTNRRSTTPTSSCSTRAASARTPTTSSTAHLGHLKSRQGRRGPTCRSSSPAAWRRRTATWSATGPPHVDVVLGTHNVHRAAVLVDEAAARRPDHRDLRRDRPGRPRRLPVGAPGAPRGCPTPPGSRSRSAATTGARSASCRRSGARRSAVRSTRSCDEVERLAADGVVEVTLLGQNVNSYGRDLDASAGRCSPTCSRAVARSTASGASATRARTRRTFGPRRSRRWRETPAVCEHLHLPLQAGQRPHAGGHAPRLHRRALPRTAGRAPGPRIAGPRRHHRPHRRLPGRDRRRLRAHARGRRRRRVRQRLHVHLLAPARHRGRRPASTTSWPATSSPNGSSGSGSSSSAAGWRSTRPASDGSRRCSSRARARRIRRCTTGRTRQNKLVHFAAADAAPLRPGTFADVASHRRRPPPPARRARRGHRRAAPPHAHPGPRRLSATAVRAALFIPLFDELSEPSVAIEIAVVAEAAGWDGVFVWDHMLYRPPVERIADPWTVMAAMALRDPPRRARADGHAHRPPPHPGAGPSSRDPRSAEQRPARLRRRARWRPRWRAVSLR